MSVRSMKAQGFTLVEILIVVVILGILAAIVIPQFTSASESARASSLTSQLQTIRGQLELYQIQHTGTYPTIATLQTDVSGKDGWVGLTTETELDGTAGDASGDELGPYMQKAPGNAFTTSSNGTQIAAAGSPAATVGWTYNATTGEVKAVLANAKALDLNLVPTGFSAGDSHPDFETY